MSKIKYVVRYYVFHNPELLISRMIKMVYLADWFSAKEYGSQITRIKWHLDRFGPYAGDVYNSIVNDRKLVIRPEVSVYGIPNKYVVVLRKRYSKEQLGLHLLGDREIKILDKVIRETCNLDWFDFVNYVYETYPVKTQKEYGYLNLAELARQESFSGVV